MTVRTLVRPSITVTGLAKYLTTPSPTTRNTELRQFKYPELGVKPASHYRDAYRLLEDYFKHSRGGSWLALEADNLEHSGHNSQAQYRLDDNVCVLRGFLSHFSNQIVQSAQPGPNLEYHHAGVFVRVKADLYAMKRKREYLVKYYFAQPDDPDKCARIICQVMYGAAMRKGFNVAYSGVQVWNCRSGRLHRAVQGRSRIQRDVETACEDIAAIWPKL